MKLENFMLIWISKNWCSNKCKKSISGWQQNSIKFNHMQMIKNYNIEINSFSNDFSTVLQYNKNLLS